jgi:hypothetical protein
VTRIVNGLAATRTRRALVRAVLEHGRIYFEPGDGHVYDRIAGTRVTARVKQLIAAAWIVAERPAEPMSRTFYRLTDFGRAALKGDAR